MPASLRAKDFKMCNRSEVTTASTTILSYPTLPSFATVKNQRFDGIRPSRNSRSCSAEGFISLVPGSIDLHLSFGLAWLKFNTGA